MKRLLLEGGGGANGAFLRAGLVDEINLVICPAVDGARGAPSVFNSSNSEAGQSAPVAAMMLDSSQVMEGGVVLLRYRIRNASPTRPSPEIRDGPTGAKAHSHRRGRLRRSDGRARTRASRQEGDDPGGAGQMRWPHSVAVGRRRWASGGRGRRVRARRGACHARLAGQARLEVLPIEGTAWTVKEGRFSTRAQDPHMPEFHRVLQRLQEDLPIANS